MKMYSVSFRRYGDYSKKYVEKIINGKTTKLNIPEGSNLIVPEFDIMKYSSYGDGYNEIKYIGEMDDKYFYTGEKETAMKAIENSVASVIGNDK